MAGSAGKKRATRKKSHPDWRDLRKLSQDKPLPAANNNIHDAGSGTGAVVSVGVDVAARPFAAPPGEAFARHTT
jgi:hypothetical protein